MKFKQLLIYLLGPLIVLALGLGECGRRTAKVSRPIPRVWDDAAFASFELPLADTGIHLKHATPNDYYRIPERRIWKSYPIYAPGKEPPGYMEWLEEQEPELVFDAAKLQTDEDWIKAGELVFDAPITYNELTGVIGVRDPRWYEKNKVPVAADGTVPFLRYVIREKGNVEVGDFSCVMCHARVMPDGSVIKGAQGNFPFGSVFASGLPTQLSLDLLRKVNHQLFAAPWVKNDPHARLNQMSREEIVAAYEALPAGVIPRFGSSLFFPPQVPDLIGVKDRHYLDHTGLMRQQSVGDLMRYSAIVQGLDILDRFGDFAPVDNPPDLESMARYSDEQLYALALYVYSLQPPPNPNQFDALAARGQEIFTRERCEGCHTPPLYTNNALMPVESFKVPADSQRRFDILPISLGTDPNLTLKTRRGTGFYKVPSLRGLWYRGPFEHNGSVATLEDWFDPRRQRSDYVPTGFRGAGVTNRPVLGHSYGLDLSPEDRKALIAFLNTL
jgi:hypothetical protein